MEKGFVDTEFGKIDTVMAINNPRFPHTLVVTREVNSGTTYDPVITDHTILSSECRNYVTTKGSDKNGVVESNYTTALPLHSTLVIMGDKITVTDTVQTIHGTVVASQIGNIGANIYYNKISN